MAECVECLPITLLPNELIYMILKNNTCRDIVNFGLTCKHFYGLISSNQYLWKEKCKVTLSKHVYDVVEEYGKGDWLRELKRYFTLKQAVYNELLSMSPKYYWRTTEISMKDIKIFFNMALAYNVNHYYVVSILRDLIKRGNEIVNKNRSEEPYTLTVMYYAKIVLRYLTQTFLATMWFQNHMRKVLTPEVVITFFVQWADATRMHTDEDVEASISDVVEKVEKMFPNDDSHPGYTVQEKVSKGLLKGGDVLRAVSDVIYHQIHMVLMPSANLDTLDIHHVLHTKCGHAIAVAAIYLAVASRCGVRCELISFPNHLFLEWRDTDSSNPILHKISLETGSILPKGRCPYSRGPMRDDMRYCPDTFLQYIIATFLMSMGALKNWTTQHATNLQDFLSTSPTEDNPYKNYQQYLLDYDLLPAMNITLKREFLDNCHLRIIEHLVKITHNPTPICKAAAVHCRKGGVIFGVGMICYHQRYNYMCVIRSWGNTCPLEMRKSADLHNLQFGIHQPFYGVVAVDQTERYVAQEHLVDVARPNRLHHLEDMIAKNFTHYDGFCYIPNAEKEAEYPEDKHIRDVFRDRFEQRTIQLMQQMVRVIRN